MIHLGTVATADQVPAARVLVDSCHRQHPGSTCTVLVVDETTDRDRVPGARVLLPHEIGIPAAVLDRMCIAYDLLELAAALKPWLLAWTLDQGHDVAVHLDPEVWLLAPLADVTDLARKHSCVLTPRLTEPMPRDDRSPTEQTLLQSGVLDTGFVAVGDTPDGRAMLAWWQQRLRTDGFVDLGQGFASDRIWAQFVPGLFASHLVRDPGWNVGYWNLATRRLTRAPDGALHSGGYPTTFVQMRGYSPGTPHLLSREQGPRPRVLLSEDPVLRDLCDRYAGLLRDAGWRTEGDETRARPFVWHDGIALDPLVRRLVRDELRAEAVGRGTGLGWTVASGVPLASWLLDPEPGNDSLLPGLGRYLSAAYRSRPDVQVAFPQAWHGDHASYLGWLDRHGIDELGLDLANVVEARGRAHRPDSPRTEVVEVATPGVEVVGYLSAELGLGEMARQFVASLEAAGIPVSTRTYTRTSSRKSAGWSDRLVPRGTRHDTTLLCVNADMLPVMARDLGPAFFADRYHVGVWFWELARWPGDLVGPALPHVDEVWVASQFNARGLARLTDKPITVMPLPAHAPDPSSQVPPELGDDAFTFLFVFDFLSVLERKNPLGLVDAFDTAFPEPGEARLVIKSINADKVPEARERLRYACAARPDIVLIERYLSRAEMDGLMWRADCYVSLHRSEGFGLTLAETMAIGKPVVATRYSGNLEFMTDDNSLLVGQTWTPVPPGNAPYPVGPRSGWAEPKPGQSARALRRMYDDPDLRARLGAAAARTIRERHSTESLAVAAARRLAEIRDARDASS